MVAKILVEQNIDDGRRVIECLEQSGLPIEAALWVYQDEGEYWRLAIASPLAVEKGPLYVIQQLQSTLERMSPPPKLQLTDFTLVDINQDLVRRLARPRPGKSRRSEPPPAFHEGWRYSSGDVYVYRAPSAA